MKTLAEASERLWRRSKFLWWSGLLSASVLGCGCLVCFTGFLIVFPEASRQAAVTVEEGRDQRTAQPNKTKDAQGQKRRTRATVNAASETSRPTSPSGAVKTALPTRNVFATMTALAEQVLETETAAPSPTDIVIIEETAMPAPATPIPTAVPPTEVLATNVPPTAVPPPNCDPAYPDVCIPSPPPDLNCDGIPFRRFRVLPPDPHKFDGNSNGVGCESE